MCVCVCVCVCVCACVRAHLNNNTMIYFSLIYLAKKSCVFLQWDTGRGQYSGGQAAAPQGGNVGGGGYSGNQAALTGQFTDAQLAQYAASGQIQYQGSGQQGLYGTGSSPQVLKVAYRNIYIVVHELCL